MMPQRFERNIKVYRYECIGAAVASRLSIVSTDCCGNETANRNLGYEFVSGSRANRFSAAGMSHPSSPVRTNRDGPLRIKPWPRFC
jgi:hypothetical protein